MGSSQYLYNAKMREEIVEQLGVTPTPGGLELLLRQSENNRMAHGGIMNMNKGGSALMNPYERGDAAKVTAAQANPFSPAPNTNEFPITQPDPLSSTSSKPDSSAASPA